MVTGAGSGIGRAGAMIMAREGAAVVIADRDQAAGEATAVRHPSPPAAGPRRWPPTSPTTRRSSSSSLARIGKHGRIDILHNHAGIQVGGTLTEVEPDGMDASWRINVRAHFLAARLVMPSMIGAGRRRHPQHLVEFRRVLRPRDDRLCHLQARRRRDDPADGASTTRRHGVRVNALCPGWVDTPFNEPFIAQMGGREAIETYVARQDPDRPLGERRRDRRSDPVPRLRPLVLHDRPGPGGRRRRKHRLTQQPPPALNDWCISAA